MSSPSCPTSDLRVCSETGTGTSPQCVFPGGVCTGSETVPVSKQTRTLGARLRAWLASVPSRHVRSGAVALADQVVLSAVNLATGVLLARLCSKEEFGLYSLGASIVLFGSTVQGALILTPYVIFSPRRKGLSRARYAGSTLIHQLGLCVAGMVAMAVGGAILAAGIGPPELTPVVWTLAGVIGLLFLRDYARQISFADLRMEAALRLDSAMAMLQLGGLGLLVLAGWLSAASTWGIIGGASCLSVAGWLIGSRKSFRVRRRDVGADLRRNWTTGKWVFASGLVWALATYLYPWLLLAFHGSAAAGVWAACFGIVALTNPLILGVQNFLGPSIAHAYADGDRARLCRHAARAATVVTAGFLPLLAALAIAGGPLAVLVYGAKYAGYGAVVAGLAMNTLAATLSFPFSRVLFAVGRADVDFAATVVSLAVLLTAGMWLVRTHDVTGAALGLLLGNVAGLLVRYIAFLRLQVREDMGTA